jgi:hypothetical protein
MGTEVDAMKLVSSLTLFGHVAETLAAREDGGAFRELADLARVVLEHAEADGYPPCSFTLKSLRA